MKMNERRSVDLTFIQTLSLVDVPKAASALSL